MSVEVSITRGKTLASDEKVDNDKLNQGFLPSISVIGAMPITNDSFIIVEQGSSASLNGTNLKNAYAAAKNLLVEGHGVLTATVRAVVLIPPGNYEMSSALAVDTQFIDFIGLGGDPRDVRIYGDITDSSTGVVHQTVNDVRLENLMIENTADSGSGSSGEGSDPCAYFVSTGGLAPLLKNVRIKADGTNASPMRPQVEYAGTYEDVIVDGPYGFGGGDISAATDGSMSGTMRRCRAGKYTLGPVSGSIYGLICDGIHMTGSADNDGYVDGLESDMEASGQTSMLGVAFEGTLLNSRIIANSSSSLAFGCFTGAVVRGCYFKANVGSNEGALSLSGTGSYVENCTCVNDGGGDSIWGVNTHAFCACRLNKAPAGFTNSISAPNNVVDSAVS